MSRTLGETRIHEKAQRARLTPRDRPYWRTLSLGAHLGYRRGQIIGSWVARRFDAEKPGYVTATLGEADDLREADGCAVLSFKQAMDAALRWIDKGERGPPPAPDTAMTVRHAVEAYIERRNVRRSSQTGRQLNSDAHYKLTNHVLADRIATLKLATLAESDLRAWQLRMRNVPPASLQRIVNDFKAALNGAFENYRRLLPADLPTVIKFGLKLDAPEMLLAAARENQILTDDQVRRVVAAALAIDDDLGRLVVLLAATGARFSQLARMTVADVQPERSRLMIPQSFKGKKRSLQYIRVVVGADTLAALAPVVDGRPFSAPLLEHWRLRQIGPLKWERDNRGPWVAPSEMTRQWKRAVEAAGLPAVTIPYALRHSSIVRGLRAGLPIRLVAALHDTSVQMIERHYSRWITEGLDELVARAVIPIVSEPPRALIAA
jgi:integrase